MTIEQVVADRLWADPAVSGAVNGRVYMLRFPQSGLFPAVRVQLVDEPAIYHLRGDAGARRAIVQVDAVARETSGGDPFAVVGALAALINVALVGPGWSVAGVTVTGVLREAWRAMYDPEDLRLVRIMQQFTVWSR